ncbi:MAG: hypothetical protein EBU84_20535 [Actinobacteria bacterium]|nr:hypothetical protein [Actinomycetota bacterium]
MTDWPIKTLSDLIAVQNGYAFDSKYFSSVGKIGLIRIRDLKNGVDTETRYDGTFSHDYIVSAGDYLIGMDGEFRCYEWKGEPALLNQRVCRLQGFSASLESRFLFYGINKFLKDIEDVTGYTTVKHLSSKSILGIQMPVPPLEEQKRIVALLDDATARISELTACYEQARTHANNLFTSALRDALEGNPDWPVKTLGEVAVLNPSEPALSEDAPFVPMDAVTAGKRQVQYTQPRGQRSGARARAGDILFARITPCLQNGKVALIQDDIERCGGSTEFIVVRAGPEVLRGFLYQWITAEHVRDHLTALMKGTTGRQRLDAQDLATLCTLRARIKQNGASSKEKGDENIGERRDAEEESEASHRANG